MATTLRDDLDDCEAKERNCNSGGCCGNDDDRLVQRLVALGMTREELLRMEIMVEYPSIRSTLSLLARTIL
jgi:hypothetical protein